MEGLLHEKHQFPCKLHSLVSKDFKVCGVFVETILLGYQSMKREKF